MIKKQKSIPAKLLKEMTEENLKRMAWLKYKYNPVTGENAPGRRAVVAISDFLDGKPMYLPEQMLEHPFVKVLISCGSFKKYIERYLLQQGYDEEAMRETCVRYFIRLRCKHDFYFFAGCYAKIKNKKGGADINFVLRPAQVKLTKIFEKMRLSGVPIRVILLKCRQWGGSTLTDIYMGWIQIFWKTNWNSNIVGHQSTSATNVFAMYEKLISNTPDWLFFGLGDDYPENFKKFEGKGTTQNI
ncbi:MAG: terminase, partial [Prevotella sp.]|nr:terminase [Prevotella sp.]